MPPRRARSAPTRMTLGFAGSGQLDAKSIGPLLDDYTDGAEIEAVYIPVTKEDFTDEMQAVVEWCKEADISYTSVSNDAATKDRTLKKFIVEGDDYDGGESAGSAIVELLAGDEDNPVADARLIMFFNGEEDEDVKVAELAEESEVAAFDILDGLSAIVFSADEPEPEPEPEPTRRRRSAAKEEPEAEEEKPRSRRGRAAKEEPAEEPEPPADDNGGPYSPAEDKRFKELTKLGLTVLKQTLKKLNPEEHTTASLSGADKEYVADLIILEERAQAESQPMLPEDGDEAQQTPPPRRGRSRAAAAEEPAEAEEGDDRDADTREEVFARLRGNREAAERIAVGLTGALKAISEQGEDDQVMERAAGALSAALMLFAEFVITEVRKPKSAGRPRKDGTEAQPKPPVDPDAPRRPRGRPRKDA